MKASKALNYGKTNIISLELIILAVNIHMFTRVNAPLRDINSY